MTLHHGLKSQALEAKTKDPLSLIEDETVAE